MDEFIAQVECIADEDGLTLYRPGDVPWLSVDDWQESTLVGTDYMHVYPFHLEPKLGKDDVALTVALIEAAIQRGRAVRRPSLMTPAAERLTDSAVAAIDDELPATPGAALRSLTYRHLVDYWYWLPEEDHAQ